MKKFYFLWIVVFAFQAQAAEVTQTLKGKGIDGAPCSVQIFREGDELRGVELKGAAKVFEILSENGGSYGPETRVESRGGEETLSLLEKGSGALKHVRHQQFIFSAGEGFTLDSSDIPKNGEDDLKGIKMILSLELYYKNKKLVEVRASSKAKALLVPVASSTFRCVGR